MLFLLFICEKSFENKVHLGEEEEYENENPNVYISCKGEGSILFRFAQKTSHPSNS